MARNQPSKDNQNASYDTIQRTAISPGGTLGSFYDGYREDLLQGLTIRNEDKSSKLLKTVRCTLVKGETNRSNNLLQIIDMPYELRMSVLLGLTSQNGIASITDHPNRIDECTRFLYYCYTHQEEEISNKIEKIQKMDKSSIPLTVTTHIITGVNHGIDVIVVLQLPCENDIRKKIDDVLKKVCACLNNNQSTIEHISNNEELLETITETTVYSNTPPLAEMSTLRDVCSYIETNKDEATIYPIMYTLRPIQWMFPKCTEHGTTFTSTPPDFRKKVEEYVLNFSVSLGRLKHFIDTELTPLLSGNLDTQLNDARIQLQRLTKTQEDTIKYLRDLIFDVRKNRAKLPTLDRTLADRKNKTLKDVEKFEKLIEQLHDKGKLMVDLKKQSFTYCNAHDRHVSIRDNDQTLERKLTRNNRQSRVFCTNDALNKKHADKLKEQRRLLAEEHKANPDLDIVYADFTYCNFELPAMTTTKSGPPKKKKTTKDVKTPSPEKDDVINILLLGESGVGKSTFINAFVNYLTSETFDRAQSNEPVVLIPVSFLLTISDQFEERTVKFGDFVTSHNEDFDHPGESVTQRCNSYEFHLNRSDDKKLCIIDTPGFGDTRGLDQDDLNMQHILEYINNLTHLNAVCFLLKPNVTELHTFFRMCFTQLIDLLGPDVHENIIFCFTNARSTFYAPGDTARILKVLLKSPPLTDIPFKKDNTFCFDNEAFRYLVALQNGISFSELDRNEYERSWAISVKESNRLLDFITNGLKTCRMHNEWQSNKRAQVSISDTIRPMLEAMRNLLRNIILCEKKTPKECIKLCPKAIHRPATICLACPPYPTNVGKFCIAREITHEILKNCVVCPCAANEHIPINYLVRFEHLDTPPSDSSVAMNDMVERLCRAGSKFDYFLRTIAGSSKDDPFLKGLTRIIIEEESLCKNQKSNRLNSQLISRLKDLKHHYKEHLHDSKSTHSDVSDIHKLISTIRAYPPIAEQLNAIKDSQKMMSEQYEVPN